MNIRRKTVLFCANKFASNHAHNPSDFNNSKQNQKKINL